MRRVRIPSRVVLNAVQRMFIGRQCTAFANWWAVQTPLYGAGTVMTASSFFESLQPQHPIGVFDSGVGGLSVLRQLLRLLPHEDMVYLADTAWAPYGERSQAEVQARCLGIACYLRRTYHIKALVMACNTATAQAAAYVREHMSDLPLIGIEPALKPAVAQTRTGRIGIWATRGTVQSSKFQQLLARHSGGCDVRVQACDGLALAIENALDGQPGPDGRTVGQICQHYAQALAPFASRAQPDGIDTLVLGCTHYPFASAELHSLLGPAVQLLEPGEPVARQTQQVLARTGLLHPASASAPLALPAARPPAALTLLATASPARLRRAAHQWLGRSSAQVGMADIGNNFSCAG